MSAQNRTSPTQQVLDTLKPLGERLQKAETALEGLLKAAQTPASKAGVSPQEYLAHLSDSWGRKGTTPFVVGPDGQVLPVGAWQGRRVTMGKGANEYLQALWQFADKGFSAPGAAKHLEALGVQRMGLGQKNVVKTALAETSGVTGGYTVPPQFESQLFTLMTEDMIVPPRAAKLPLEALTLQVPYLDVTTSQGSGKSPTLAGLSAKWDSEANTLTEYEPTFRQFELKAHQLSFYVIASNTLLADSALALESILTQLFTKAIGWARDYAYLQGDGVGKPQGVLGAAATIGVQANSGSGAAHFRFPDVAAMLSKLYALDARGSQVCWLMHQSVLPELLQLNANELGSGNGRPIWIPLSEGAREAIPESGAGAMSFGSLLGKPVIVTEKLPALGTAGCVLLVDFSKYVLGERQELQLDVSTQVRFLNNQTVWRVIYRGDGQPWLSGAVTLADGAYQVGMAAKLT